MRLTRVPLACVIGLLIAPRAAAGEEAPAAGAAAWTIRVGRPTLEPLEGGGRDEGRIYGDLKRCPGGRIDILDADGGLVRTLTVRSGAMIYEIRAIPLGTYTVRITAADAADAVVPDLVVKGRSDTRLNIEFTDSCLSDEAEGEKPRAESDAGYKPPPSSKDKKQSAKPAGGKKAEGKRAGKGGRKRGGQKRNDKKQGRKRRKQ